MEGIENIITIEVDVGVEMDGANIGLWELNETWCLGKSYGPDDFKQNLFLAKLIDGKQSICIMYPGYDMPVLFRMRTPEKHWDVPGIVTENELKLFFVTPLQTPLREFS